MTPVLLAEQHAPTLEHLKVLLAQAGYQVHTSTDPGAAMEQFVAAHAEAVIVAVDFPKLENAHLGQLIRGSERGVRVPIIAIDKGHLGKAKGVGAILDIKANAYIADPLKGSELVTKLGQLLTALKSVEAAQPSGLAKLLQKPPVVAGDLQGFPLPSLLHSFYRVQREGVLVVVFRELTRRVFFVKGGAVNYDSTARQDSLPRYLVERGDVTEAQAETVQVALSAGKGIGLALSEAGAALEGEELLQKLKDYTRERVAQVTGMREGRYAFYSGTDFLDTIAAVEIPALAPILEGARRNVPLKLFAAPLKGQLESFPSRSAEFGKDLPALGLDTNDLKIAMQMNGRIPLHDLLAHGRGDLRAAYSLLWFLNLTGALRLEKAPTASADAQAYSPQDTIAPRKRKPLPAEIVGELRDAAVKIVTGSYFRVLGLDITADTEGVERAYHQVAAKFHPDSYPEFDTSEIRDLLDSVQDKLAASYRVLSVEDKRKAYLQYLLSRLDVGRSVGINVDAEIALKRGEGALKRKDLVSALLAFEDAIALNPREPEYYTYFAWATYNGGPGDQKERAKGALRILKKALALNPYQERAVIITAIIEGEQGDHPGARKRLLKVLEMNPSSKLAKAALLKVGR